MGQYIEYDMAQDEITAAMEVLIVQRIQEARRRNRALCLVPDAILRVIYLDGFGDGVEVMSKITNAALTKAVAVQEASEAMKGDGEFDA